MVDDRQEGTWSIYKYKEDELHIGKFRGGKKVGDWEVKNLYSGELLHKIAHDAKGKPIYVK